MKEKISAEEREFWRKCRTFDLEGFSFFCEKVLRIRTLEDSQVKIVPFVLNEEQRVLATMILDGYRSGKPVRLIVLKSRKQGVSSLIQALAFYFGAMVSGFKSLTVAHQSDATKEIASISTVMNESLPAGMRMRVGAKALLGGLKWSNGSSIRVMTQRSDNASRGASPNLLHLSEVGLWDDGRANSSANDALTALLGSLELAGGTICVIESTACGASGAFYDRWQSAVANPNGLWKPVFLKWQDAAKYTPTLTDEDQTAFDRMKEHVAKGEPLAAMKVYEDLGISPLWVTRALEFDLSPAQCRWAMKKTEELGEKFDQEFPLSASMAFLSSGRPVFPSLPDPEPSVPVMTSGALKPWQDGTTDIRSLSTHPGTTPEWIVWDAPIKGWMPGRYVVGSDVASGGGRDYSTAVVYDRETQTIAAEFASNRIPPDEFAIQLDTIGRLYGSAVVAPECQGPGLTTISKLLELQYPLLYRHKVQKESNNLKVSQVINWTQITGWSTTSKTRGPMLDLLAAQVRTGKLKIRSERMHKEARGYRYIDGRMDHEPSGHDDSLVAAAIALSVCEGMTPPRILYEETTSTWKQPRARLGY